MAAYDVAAAGYDALYSGPEYLEENRKLFDLIKWQPEETVLDVGCGTGLFWEYNDPEQLVLPVHYRGLDPSSKMLEMFAQKFPAAVPCLHNGKFENYNGPGADLVLALFGVPNYIRPESVAKLLEFVNPGGRYFALFHPARDYNKTVRAHIEFKLEIKYWSDNGNLLPGARTDFGPYVLVTGTKSWPEPPEQLTVRQEISVPKPYRPRTQRPGQRSAD